MNDRNVLIYSRKIAKPSETFIIEPALALKRYHAYFVASLRRKHLDVPDERVFTTNSGNGRLSLLKQAVKRRIWGHNGVPHLAKQVSKINPKLLQAHFGHEAIHALPLATRLNIPFIIYYHGLDASIKPESVADNPFWRRYFETMPQLHNSATLVLTQSDFLRRKVIELGFPESKVRRQYIGVKPATEVPTKYQEREKIVLFVARLVEKKGLEYLLSAMSNVQQTYRDLKLVVIGDGDLKVNLEKQAISEGLNCEFLGWKSYDDVLQWMKKALIFCVPSITADNGDSEGFGMVFIEAQRSGTPVVSTQHGGIVESVAHGYSGLLVPEKDVVGLSQNIQRLYEDQDLWEKFSNQAYHRVKNEFGLHDLVSQLENIYDEVIERHT